MGGIGSGNHIRLNRKTTTVEVKQISVYFMNQQGYLKEGYKGKLSWSSNGRSIGSINFKVLDSFIHFSYSYRVHGDDWKDYSINVRLTTTSCHYGSSRYWFICPSCRKRVGILYLENISPSCRCCSDIVYISKNSSDIDQLNSKISKLSERIFEAQGKSYIKTKKKGMHWNTYYRLLDDLKTLKAARDKLISDLLGLEY